MTQTALKQGDELIELPSGTKVLYRPSSHRYWLAGEEITEVEPGRKLTTVPCVGVTTITGAYDKPALLPWAEQQTCEALLGAVEGGEPLAYRDGRLTPEGALQAMREAERGWRFTRDRAATRGNSVHEALQRLAVEGQIPRLGDFPAEDRGYVQALVRFWLDAKPETVACEVVVASEELCVAGRLDLEMRLTEERVLVTDAETGEVESFAPGFYRLDAKTAKAIYPVENYSQLEAYERLAIESGREPSDGRIVLRLDESGAYEVALSTAGPDTFTRIHAGYVATKELRDSRAKKPKREAVKA
jgi:hypothetical protein